MVGKTLGHYEILEPLGAGGMGEVYRARDTKLDRDVAIKVLPEDFATDQDRLARFEREAKLLASLNHANIATIYGLEDEGEQRFIVMEVVEGETLAERISRSGRIEPDETLEIARQIAEALEAAHENGVIHRDLKPANVIVTVDGKAKVLDFGLAKAYDAAGTTSDVAPDLSHSPTMAEATRTGVILGTAAYMSPEQARGKPVDKRTDIWAFGCVVFEMLTGKRAFDGETVSDVMAAILTATPGWEALPAAVPARIRYLLERCLAREALQRLRDIGEARILLDPTALGASGPWRAPPEEGDAPTRRVVPVLAVVGLVAAAVGSTWLVGNSLRGGPATAPAPTTHLPIAPLRGVGVGYWHRPLLAISPDGQRVAYVGSRDGLQQLYVQDLDAPRSPIALPETVDAQAPFFSPDGRQVGFFQDSRLRTMHIGERQQARELAPIGMGQGGYWGASGIDFIPSFGAPILRANVDGTVEEILAPGESEAFLYPQVLPDDEHVVLTLWDNRSAAVVVQSIVTGTRTTIAEDAVYGRYSQTGHVLYVRGSELLAVSFDPSTKAIGPEVLVTDNVVSDQGESFAEFAVANDGTLLYLEAPVGGSFLHRLRPGQPPEVLNSDPLSPLIDYDFVDVSPDGRRIAFTRDDLDVWLFDLDRMSLEGRVTGEPGYDWAPVWSLNGERLVIASMRTGAWAFWELPIDSNATPRLLLENDDNKWPGGLMPDGTLLWHQVLEEGGGGMFRADTSAGGEPQRLLGSEPVEHPRFSDNGTMIVYHSVKSGRSEVYVTRYPELSDPERVSNDGGWFPKFAENDSAIFYSRGTVVMRVPLNDADAMAFGEPEEFARGVDSLAWDVMPDGSAIIAVVPRPEPLLRLILGANALFEEN